ncbi:hypothetical protein FPQ18DRAFT_391682 [Pyronema domesticum]|nr:hypothetical protein FPQ18DRAFT_391682 [Pyronema domesticum]
MNSSSTHPSSLTHSNPPSDHRNSSSTSPPAASNPAAIAVLLADLQAAFQEYDINLPSNHALHKLKDERDRALERAIRLERERDEALRARDAALKLAEESYGELRALMDSRARRIQELRDVRDIGRRQQVNEGVQEAQRMEDNRRMGERERERRREDAMGDRIMGNGGGEWE